MGNMNCKEWKKWIEVTYKDNALLKSVFLKIESDWQKESDELRSQLKQYKEWLEEEGNIFPDTPTIFDTLKEQME